MSLDIFMQISPHRFKITQIECRFKFLQIRVNRFLLFHRKLFERTAYIDIIFDSPVLRLNEVQSLACTIND